MRRWSPIVAFLVALAPCPVGAPEQAAAEPAALRLAPPIAARKPVRLTAHGIERVDDYAWLRDPNWREVIQDPSRLAADIRGHLDAENSYAEAVLAPLSGLRVKLVEEMKGRIEPDDSGVPLPDGPYAYWRKYVPGAEHPRIVRAPSGGGPEQVLLDGPALAAGKSYFSFGEYHHSPDHRLYAYLVDETGSESYDLRIRDLGTGRDLPEVIATAARCSTSGSTTSIARASSIATGREPTRSTTSWSTRRRIWASAFRSTPRAAAGSW